jgi:hypothetical protein
MSWWMVGAAVVSGIAQVSQGDQQRRALHYQQDVERQNARLAREQSGVNEDAQRRMAAVVLGRQAAAAADGSGLSGTNADLIEQSAANAEMDALNIRYKGKLGVMSHDTQANIYGASADSASTAGYQNAAASALSSYGSYRNTQAKVNGGLS